MLSFHLIFLFLVNKALGYKTQSIPALTYPATVNEGWPNNDPMKSGLHWSNNLSIRNQVLFIAARSGFHAHTPCCTDDAIKTGYFTSVTNWHPNKKKSHQDIKWLIYRFCFTRQLIREHKFNYSISNPSNRLDIVPWNYIQHTYHCQWLWRGLVN